MHVQFTALFKRARLSRLFRFREIEGASIFYAKSTLLRRATVYIENRSATIDPGGAGLKWMYRLTRQLNKGRVTLIFSSAVGDSHYSGSINNNMLFYEIDLSRGCSELSVH